MGINQRIKAAREAKGWSMEQLAKRVSEIEGASKVLAWQTVQQWEKAGGTAPKMKRLEAVASALDTDVMTLLGQRSAHANQVVEATSQVATAFLPGFEQLSIPLLANSGSMGPGEDQLHDEVVVGRLTVSPHWVQRTIKPLTKLENLRFIHGYGDSMDPTFADGDILLVDIGVQEPKIDGVYVLEANDRIYIKRVRQRINGEFEISSDNPTVKTVDVLDGSAPVAVRGRVVWAWNGKKM